MYLCARDDVCFGGYTNDCQAMSVGWQPGLQPVRLYCVCGSGSNWPLPRRRSAERWKHLPALEPDGRKLASRSSQRFGKLLARVSAVTYHPRHGRCGLEGVIQKVPVQTEPTTASPNKVPIEFRIIQAPQ